MQQPVFVGDIQGCGDEFAELVRRAEVAHGPDLSLYLVGDLVNRGPANRQVLEIARRWIDDGRGEAVLGNHEIGLLEVSYGLREPGPFDTAHELLAAPDAGEWMDWLRQRPLCVDGRLGGAHFVMVHASVHPAWDLAQIRARARAVERRLRGGDDEARRFLRDREDSPEGKALGRFVNCRSVGAGDRWSSALPAGDLRPWHAAWAERPHDHGVVYGHWALQGLHIAPGLRGLDTGCVHNGRGRQTALTAWVPDLGRDDPFALPDEGFLAVPARRRYYRAEPSVPFPSDAEA